MTQSQLDQQRGDSSLLLFLDAAEATGTGPATAGCGTLRWTDLSGHSDGTLSDFVCSGVSGWSGSGTAASPYALDFDAAGRVSTTVDVQPSALPSTTWEVWVAPTRVNYGADQHILSDLGGPGYDRSLVVVGSSTEVGVYTGNGVWSPTTVDADRWQHLAVVFTPEDIYFYKNGKGYEFGHTPAFGSTTQKLMIGAEPAYGDPFQGGIAQVAIYNRALTADEIVAHCRERAALFTGVVCE